MPALVDFSKYNLNNGSAAYSEAGEIIGHILPAKNGDAMLVEPVNRASVRDVAGLTIEVAKANPEAEVGFDFSGNYYKVSKDDTLTSAILRFKDERGIGHINPGYYLDIVRDREDAAETVLKKNEANVPLFNVVIDAIRLSRARGGQNIEFQFNRHRLTVGANDDAEEVERMIPANERLGNVPAPVPARKPQPETKLGKFTIRSKP